jgi:phenylacetate-CoA oxygenase PaaI subunit
MTTETQRALRVTDPTLLALLQRLADNKYWLGRRYAEWCTSAPTLESAVAAAAMSQDEIGHARSHYPLFRQFLGHDIEPEDIDEFHSLAALDQPFGSWVDFVAANFLIDTALSTVYESAFDSSYDDLRNRARRILGEEHIHWLHGLGWVRRLAKESPGTKQALDDGLGRLWTETVMWFGAPEDVSVAELVSRAVLSASPSELRDRFIDRVWPHLDGWTTTIEKDVHRLPWTRWDAEHYRLT